MSDQRWRSELRNYVYKVKLKKLLRTRARQKLKPSSKSWGRKPYSSTILRDLSISYSSEVLKDGDHRFGWTASNFCHFSPDLLKYNSCTIKFSSLKCVVWWFLVHSELCIHHHCVIPESFVTPLLPHPFRNFSPGSH